MLDSSDVVLMVLDARDPIGTRCRNVEKYLREEKPHKHLIFILNKCDLVPPWITVSFKTHIFKQIILQLKLFIPNNNETFKMNFYANKSYIVLFKYLEIGTYFIFYFLIFF